VEILSYYDSQSCLKAKISQSDINLLGIGAKDKYDINAILKLYKILKDISPDIIHTHHNITGILARLFSKFLKSPILVSTLHSIHSDKHQHPFFSRIMNGLTLNQSNFVIFNSKTTQMSLPRWIKNLTSSKKQTVIYNGVDIDRIDRNANKNISKDFPCLEKIFRDYFTICNVANLRKVKDQATLISALKLIHKTTREVKLIIIGGGELRVELEHQVVQNGLQGHVIFTGELNRDYVYKLLHRCNCFVISSLWEGFCNAVIEAMAAEKPIIATQVGALPEIVGNVGKLIPPRDPEGMAKEILWVMDNPLAAKAMGKAGRRRAVQNYSIKKTANKYENLYIKLLKKRNKIRE